ncbi:MAG: hypothetical protein RLZZ612_1986 [Pseudomonadota bacterium]|jgi:general secretion pathway protein I
MQPCKVSPQAWRGFTLIETLVALAIVAIALAAGAQATQALTRTSERQADQVLAQLCAENALHALRLSRQMPGVGISTSECAQALQTFVAELDIQPTPNPNFRRVDVRVRRAPAMGNFGQAPTLMHISTVVGRY